MQTIALDDQPFFPLENTGFHRFVGDLGPHYELSFWQRGAIFTLAFQATGTTTVGQGTAGTFDKVCISLHDRILMGIGDIRHKATHRGRIQLGPVQYDGDEGKPHS